MPRILQVIVIVGAVLVGLTLLVGRAAVRPVTSALELPQPRIQVLDPETAPIVKDQEVDMTAVRAALEGEADQTVARLIPTSDPSPSGSFATDNPDTTVDDVIGSITTTRTHTESGDPVGGIEGSAIVEDESGRELFRLPSGQLIGT